MNKKELRLLMKEKRTALCRSKAEEKSGKICEMITETEQYKKAGFIAIYLAIQNEACVDRLADSAFSDGKRVCVPVVCGDEMYFSEIYKNDNFVCGKFGIKEPEIKRRTNGADLIFVPGLAFSKDGSRLGRGGGYYDRILAKTTAETVGVCYEFQICDKIQAEPHDRKVGRIITERGMIDCE